MNDVEKQEEARTAERLESGMNPVDPTWRAKNAVVKYWNGGHEKYNVAPITEDNVYIVWFSYILGGWKALISSDGWTDTSYFEVTYNLAKEEIYVDHYRKVNNKCYPDDSDFKMAQLRKKLS